MNRKEFILWLAGVMCLSGLLYGVVKAAWESQEYRHIEKMKKLEILQERGMPELGVLLDDNQ